MPNNIVWSQNALNQFRSTVIYWDRRNQSQAYSKRLKHLLNREIELIRKYPYAFPEVAFGIRKMVFDNFILNYLVFDDRILIIHMYDCRQLGPDYRTKSI